MAMRVSFLDGNDLEIGSAIVEDSFPQEVAGITAAVRAIIITYLRPDGTDSRDKPKTYPIRTRAEIITLLGTTTEQATKFAHESAADPAGTLYMGGTAMIFKVESK
ncbi:hypothetical protein KA517_01830 [Candidatus Gracilibacteria bacterium]|nr:hypothetical protein [Candidatus Gracilibacteria bacterium]